MFQILSADLRVGSGRFFGDGRGALSERNADLPPVCVRLEREKEEVSME